MIELVIDNTEQFSVLHGNAALPYIAPPLCKQVEASKTFRNMKKKKNTHFVFTDPEASRNCVLEGLRELG